MSLAIGSRHVAVAQKLTWPMRKNGDVGEEKGMSETEMHLRRIIHVSDNPRHVPRHKLEVEMAEETQNLNDDETQEISDEQLDETSGGYIYGSAWSKISQMASEKKREGWTREQFQRYLWKWREETKMEGFTDGNLDRDFDSILDYAYTDWNFFS